MRHPSKVGAYCSRKNRNRTDTTPTGVGRMPTKVTGKRGPRPRMPVYVPFALRLWRRRRRDMSRARERAARKALREARAA